MPSVYLLTGSNVGNSLQYLSLASALISQQVGTIQHQSAYYKTAPWGNTEQQDFLNQVLQVITPLKPAELIQKVLQIELDMGRVRTHKWAPRVIDIDVLFYDSDVIDMPGLTVPHPLLHERRFTLIPLCEIAPNFVHPLKKLTINELLINCTDQSVVEKL